ncbi:heparinase II/III family protein [uncultured Roseivirga sp.]|uniref:heparinase II/III domain-containing protein n=1 Tax=uncultured Roseivirga sp. TaxID=543088 RepID=UPI0030DDD4F8
MKARIIIFILGCFSAHFLMAQHPSLILTKAGVEQMRKEGVKSPLFSASLNEVQKEVDEYMAKGINVPMPKDLAGGYTHEQHKSNFFMLQKAGVLFQVTGNEDYARFIHETLKAYALLFPTFDRHPSERSYAPGKFFWQCLNDANWLVYVSQAYDCIYDWISEEERNDLNSKLFRPMADFLSVETPQFFNRIHNHSTWANAAVGMIGLVMDDEELIQRALYGLKSSDLKLTQVDNDGGSILQEGQQEAGFIAQIDFAFSPDGYFTEGPYYQRYAMYPFLIFGQALANKRTGLKIFEHRNGLLINAVYALLYQTNSEGEFFPINDAQKGMSIYSRELITAVSTAFHYGNKDEALLSIIADQGKVSLDDAGLEAALVLEKANVKPFVKPSIQFTDGPNGDEGGVGILRQYANEDELTLVMKYAKHGMGHGHFDQLSFLYYLNGDEIIQDYGAARWVNIEQKSGGGYLNENKTWAKQTVAHNTLVINNASQFGGNVTEADKYHGEPYLFNGTDENLKVVSAKNNQVYENTGLHRSMVMIKHPSFENPILLDLFRVTSTGQNDYDLPLLYQGQLMKTSFDFEIHESMEKLGSSDGYEHLWNEAEAPLTEGTSQVSWFNKNRFYTQSFVSTAQDKMIHARLGATDPEFNLRRDPILITRRTTTGNTLFASILEVHGAYSTVSEIATNTYSQIQQLEILRNDEQYSLVAFTHKNGGSWVFAISNNDNAAEAKHEVVQNGEKFAWKGSFHLFDQSSNQK